jgi:SOS-response transcriptional repressor LexA
MSTLRPTKKQLELLQFIEGFIAQHGYSPSYREIMNGLAYNSVATVALHVGNLVKRGHLIKRANSARSLEPTHSTIDTPEALAGDSEKSAWLFQHIEQRFKLAEAEFEQAVVDEIYVLIGSIKVLGFHDQAVAYIGRLRQLETGGQ